jgi:transcriptional regulator with XRE-family HTH domain
MKITNAADDEAVLEEIAHRVRRVRLNRQTTQADLAQAAGLARPTIERFEASGVAQLSTLVRILRALDLLDGLDLALPEAVTRPREARKSLGEFRKRASRPRKSAP